MARFRSLVSSSLLVMTLASCQGEIAANQYKAGSGRSDEKVGCTAGVCKTTSSCKNEEASFSNPKFRRLGIHEYENAIESLFDVSTEGLPELGKDEEIAGFSANTSAPVDANLVETLVASSELVAERARKKHKDTWFACGIDKEECVRSFIQTHGERVMRRPMEEAEVKNYVDAFNSVKNEVDVDAAIETMLISFLNSPDFLYVTEVGNQNSAGQIELKPWELASSLAFFLWDSPPDDELLNAAKNGKLDSQEEIEAQVDRMVKSQKFVDATVSFMRALMHLEETDAIVRNREVFPWWNDELAQKLDHEFDDFIREVIQSERPTFQELFSASYTMGDETLAAHYGAESKDGRIALNPEERAGLLTMGIVLAAQSRPHENDWIHRGLLVRRQLLCDGPPPAPPSADLSQNQNDGRRLENPECSGCHIRMDPIGMGMDGYDATGKFVGGEHKGEIYAGMDFGMNESFTGAIELAEEVAGSEHGARCFSTQAFRLASARLENTSDACGLNQIQSEFIASGGNIPQLFRSIATSSTFRTRSPYVEEKK